ncbi:MAG TPA: hypothetical protein VL576_00910 [Candidatus Paceibacterota bacterium]|jgi:hypothetical protein|nr:hypothetical protein [Candidatus Paceibacterota bacterium]
MTRAKRFLQRYWIVITVVLLVAALCWSVWYFIYSFRTSYSEGELRPMYHSYIYNHSDRNDRGSSQQQQHQLSADDIQSWMTFDYINVVFKIPKDYFKNIFGITDSRYPNIRIDTYARDYSINPLVMISTVRYYINAYTSH